MIARICIKILFVVGICVVASLFPLVYGAEKPRWELGLGISGISIPDYVGSDKQRSYILPIPYFIYRGDRLKVDRRGIRGDLFASERIKLDISLNAGIPVNSEKNGARQGMPDLDPTIEVGPSLQVILSDSDVYNRTWSLRFPLRAVIATDLSHTQQAGWVLHPQLHFLKLTEGGWGFNAALGPIYGTESYHDYYYEVAPVYATSVRPAYDAESGYGGMVLNLFLGKRFPKFWVGVFGRYYNLSGAAFEQSPLVKKQHAYLVGGGISWILAKSKQSVPLDD